jgi:hypothetical protein
MHAISIFNRSKNYGKSWEFLLHARKFWIIFFFPVHARKKMDGMSHIDRAGPEGMRPLRAPKVYRAPVYSVYIQIYIRYRYIFILVLLFGLFDFLVIISSRSRNSLLDDEY